MSWNLLHSLREDLSFKECRENNLKRNIKLVIEYDGTDFNGWQVQTNERTVQGELQKALNTLLNQRVQLVGAGRTDTGVHALGQVANFTTDSNLHIEKVHRGLNSLLPDDIIVRETEEVSRSFNARYDAQARRYQYRITQRKLAIGRQYAWYVSFPLNMSQIESGTEFFRGQQDFRSFCASESSVAHYTCTVYNVYWEQHEHGFTFDIEADRFLQHMVRTMVGTLVAIGRGRWPANAVQHILKQRDRRKAGPTAPPHGLFLAEVRY